MANFKEKEKDNVFMRIVKYLIPWKGDKPVDIFRKIIFVVSAVVLIVSLVHLITYYAGVASDNKKNESLSDLFHGGEQSQTVEADDDIVGGSTTVDIDTGSDSGNDTTDEKEPEIMDQFLPLLEINEDIVGWISMGDEDDPFIDYVVVQGDDNDFYLDHNYMKEKNVGGSIFADYRHDLSAGNEPANTILYGHNMASGEYFGKVPRYFNYKPGQESQGIEFYKTYPTFTFSTLYEKHTYKIFGGMMVNTQTSEGEVFYYLNGREFNTKAEFDDYVAQILDRSTFYTDVDLKYGDHLITLSTCIMDYGEWNLRWVLFGRRVREGEDPTVDVSKAYANPDPLYFDAYYRVYGGQWGGRKWPAEMIFDYSY